MHNQPINILCSSLSTLSSPSIAKIVIMKRVKNKLISQENYFCNSLGSPKGL